MAELIWMLMFCCVAGLHHRLNASPVVRQVQAGLNVSMQCNFNLSEVTWYFWKSGDVIPLISSKTDRMTNKILLGFCSDEYSNRIQLAENHETNKYNSLEILAVNETDLGFYYCTARIDGIQQFGNGIYLSFGEKNVVKVVKTLPCWIVMAIVVSTMMTTAFIVFGMYFWSARRSSNHVNGVLPLKGEGDLHYASLNYRSQPRPKTLGGTGLAPEEVTYTTIFHGNKPGSR